MNLCRRRIVVRSCRGNTERPLLRLLSLRTIIGVGIILLCGIYFLKRFSSNKATSANYTNYNFINTEHHKKTEDNDVASNNERRHYAKLDDVYTAKYSAKQKPMLLPNIYSSCSQFNFSFSSVILEPDLANEKSNLFLFVIITSGVGEKVFLEKRNASRSTWLKRGNPSLKTWRHVFLLGRTHDHEPQVDVEIRREAALHNDILLFDSIDNYDNLIIKVLSGFRWAFAQAKPRFILKADDDVYIRVPQLITWLSTSGRDNLYGGVVNSVGLFKSKGPSVRRQPETQLNSLALDCYAEDSFPPYSAGPFYIISSNMIPSLFENMRKWKVFPVEDAYMGILARASGLKPVDVPGFKIKRDSNALFFHKCTWASVVALGHNYNSSQLNYIHNKVQETDDLQLSRNFLVCLARESLMSYMHLILLSGIVVGILLYLCCNHISPAFRQNRSK